MERTTKVLCIKTTVNGKGGHKKTYCKKLVVFPKMIENILDVKQGDSVSFNVDLDKIKERVIEIKIGH